MTFEPSVQDVLLALLVIAFGAWAAVVRSTGQEALRRLDSLQRHFDTLLGEVRVELAQLRGALEHVEKWQSDHIQRPHIEAIRALDNHAGRIERLEKELEERVHR